MQRTATAYDVVPYRSVAFAQTHPARVAAVARIFGLSPADVANCRVLELGCASGGNLIPMAFNLPGSRFVGVDLSRVQVDEAQAAIGALNLPNITIEHGSILDVDAAWGEFDYIICHGVFSWVEAPVQDRILRVAHDNLAVGGIAYISYNTYPGWHMREMVRHMMRYHAGQFEQPGEQIEQARALLAFLASASETASAYGQLLNAEVERVARASDSYLYHEHLEQTNAPLYFHQFIERAERFGLFYLSESVVSDMMASHFPQTVAETLERVSPDILHLEQYMDFVRNRQFRQTLLCRREVRPKRALAPAVLHGLLAASGAVPERVPVDLAAGKTVTFWNGPQRADLTLPATKAAFAVLRERWPQAIDVDELCATGLERAAPFLPGASPEESGRAMLADLFQGALYGMIQLYTRQLPCTNRPSDRPRAHPLAAWQAETGNVVVNAHHETLELDALSRQVLRLANGARSRSEILQALADLHGSGQLTIEDRGAVVAAPETARAILATQLEKVVASLTRRALFVG